VPPRRQTGTDSLGWIALLKGGPDELLSPEGSALQREPQVLAHQVANPVGATTVTP
jgi:hypothetical protein